MEGINTIHNTGVSLFSIVKAGTGSGRINLPVSSSSSLVAGFKHISVMPVPGNSGIQGFSVSKLRALDNLIDMLVRTGSMKDSEIVKPNKNDIGGIDAAFTGYADKLSGILASNTPYKPPVETKGFLVNGLI